MITHHTTQNTVAAGSYVSTCEAALILGRTPDTVRLLARRGQLTTAINTRAGRLYWRRDVEELAKRRDGGGARGAATFSVPNDEVGRAARACRKGR